MSLLANPRLIAWRDRLVPAELDMGWASFISLGYLAFLYLPFLLPRIAARDWLGPTIVIMLAFLPLYFRAYWAQGRELVLLTVAMWALALLLAPLNPFSNSLVIFACAFAPHLRSLRNALLLALLLTTSFSIYILVTVRGAPLTVGITYLVGAACFVGSYFMRQSQRRQVALRLSHEEVRRLASEGFRPRLPWGAGVPALKKDPSPILPVLELLKQDPAETVRRSVANNLNDISKEHPDLVLGIARRWQGLGLDTDWIIKHACRGLLKKGHPEALAN